MSGRAIYSNVMGFFGGVAWAMLIARICQLYPNAIAGAIVSRFFIIMYQWWAFLWYIDYDDVTDKSCFWSDVLLLQEMAPTSVAETNRRRPSSSQSVESKGKIHIESWDCLLHCSTTLNGHFIWVMCNTIWPKLYPIDRGHLMPIITPAYPSMCATHNVTASTKKIIESEFKRGEIVLFFKPLYA